MGVADPNFRIFVTPPECLTVRSHALSGQPRRSAEVSGGL